MSSEYPSPAKSRDQSPWRVFKGRRPWAQAAQARALGAPPRVSRVAATLPFRDGLPFPAGVHSIYARCNIPGAGWCAGRRDSSRNTRYLQILGVNIASWHGDKPSPVQNRSPGQPTSVGVL